MANVQKTFANIHHSPGEQQDTSMAIINQNWQQVLPRKRTINDASERNVKPRTQRTLPLSPVINTENRFQALDTIEQSTTNMEQEEEEKIISSPKPPPIFIPDVMEISPLVEILDSVAKDNYFLKTIGNNQIKVQSNNSDTYRKISNKLKQINASFHTYQLKQERSYRVVIKNLHHTTSIEDIKEELKEKGHNVTNVYNITQKFTKQPLPIFFIELAPDVNNKNIYNIQYVQHTKVQIEPPRTTKQIPQCARCQRYGHTKSYCSRPMRCVKCAGNHWTRECEKLNTTPPTCVLCQEAHPANYKGCKVHKEIQSRKFPPQRERVLPTQLIPKIDKPVNPNITYSQVVTNHTKNEEPNIKLEQMMLKLMERMDNILTLLTTLVAKIK